MAKEPAGLRRWRLAHRKHKRRRVVHTMARRRRSYRGYKRKGHRGSKAIPLLMLAPVMPGVKAVWDARGEGPVQATRKGIGAVTGIDIMGEVPIQTTTIAKTVGLVVVGLVGHKVASKLGINRQLKKLTFGYIQL